MTQPILTLNHVTYRIEQLLDINMTSTCYTLLKNITFSVNAGEVIAIVGANGSGKSTLCRLIAGIIQPTAGTLSLHTKHYNKITPHWQIHQEIGMLFQEIDEQFIGKNYLEDTQLYLSNFYDCPNEINQRLTTSATLLGVQSLIQQPFQYLSGGHKQLLALAQILALKPKLIILDEPTAQLDSHNESLVIGAIQKITQTTDTTIIIVSHKLVELQLTQKIIGLNQGTMQAVFETAEFLLDIDRLKSFTLPISDTVTIYEKLRLAGLVNSPLTNVSISHFTQTVCHLLFNEKR